MSRFFFIVFASCLCFSCHQKPDKLFTRLSSGETGIDFDNSLLENNERFNVMQYPYFYNGGGVAVGDINNDGLPDIIFTGNMVKNRLYLNKGNFQFDDITEKSGIASKEGWCTGVTLADVNNDGWLDVYICRSGFSNPALRKNLLFINNHDLTFTEEAESYGIADQGYSTQASFFDYDKDGDLDLIVINQSTPEYAQGGQEYSQLRNKPAQAIFQNHLYRNDNGHFTDVTAAAGIHSNVLTFSLGLSTADIDQDGWPDIYISNDFNEPDYLLINNHHGGFEEKLKEKIDHTSLYSMGCDIADFNNDGLPDICTLDMLPENNHDLKMHNGADNYDKFNYLFQLGFGFQYMKNSLQKNNGDGSFSEIGQLAGISNTDWSWSPLFADFDNDGLKDLFVSNGYKRDNTNLQFIKYTMNETLRMQQGGEGVKIQDYVGNMQGINIDNYAFHNLGDDQFDNKTNAWNLQGPGFSNGAVYADLDNDGDLDIVTNNIDEEAGIYRNNNEIIGKNNYLRFILRGNKENPTGIGSKIFVYYNHQTIYLEQLPVRGYQSSVDMVLHAGLGTATRIDSLRIIWPGDQTQLIKNSGVNQTLELKLADAREIYQYQNPDVGNKLFKTQSGVLDYLHQENSSNDFNRQILLPKFYSHNGPCMARGDVNGDGLEDIYLGASAGHHGVLFMQNSKNQFIAAEQQVFLIDTAGDETAALFFDANGDGFPDLYIAKGGYGMLQEGSKAFEDKLYLNNGHGHFTLTKDALPKNFANKTCVAACDIDGDGDLDLFVGGGVVPGKWPLSCNSAIYINDGQGKFTDRTDQWNASLKTIGIVNGAVWVDINQDRKKDLVLVGEWMAPTIFTNEKTQLKYSDLNKSLAVLKGWWNCISVGDFNRDGKMDLVIGNYGLNSPLKASEKEPVQVFVTDIDNNGIIDPVMTSFIQNKSYPFAAMDDITKQVGILRRKFYDYNQYADAAIQDIIPEEKLKGLKDLRANTFQTMYLKNTGSGFVEQKLPIEAQYAPVYSIVVQDLNQDGFPDLILFGNNQFNRIRLGKDDANHGTVLLNDGKGEFGFLPPVKTGLQVHGDTRSAMMIGSQLFVGVNSDTLRVLKLQ